MTQAHDQWIRKVSLIVLAGEEGIDLSAFRIKFTTQNTDMETPNNANIRVYNLSETTVNKIRKHKEYSRVVLNAGYENGNFGVIFDGTIIQYRFGRENNRDTYLDILANDGDIGYNQGFVNTPLSKGSTWVDMVKASVAAMKAEGGELPVLNDKQHTLNLRGAVLFGMARAKLRYLTSTLDASWSIQNGKVQIIPLTGYLQGEAVNISRGTGLIGVPEQTDGGITLQCLLNPKIRIGGLVKLNNDEFNQLMQRDPDGASLMYNQRSGFQHNTALSKDGSYRAYVVEHSGDTRGNDWHSHLICLAVDLSSNKINGIG